MISSCQQKQQQLMMTTRKSEESGAGIRCQDCGNQSKRGCAYMRCRTCCKSRHFHCQTHVKSTWIPAYRRRQRQQQPRLLSDTHAIASAHQEQLNPGANRDINPSSGVEVRDFPAEVNSLAVFRRVGVSSMADEVNEQCAYQTVVNIGGHVFKGILFDQGLDGSHYSSFRGLHQTLSTPITTTSAVTEQLFPPPFPFPFNPLMPAGPGMQFFTHHK